MKTHPAKYISEFLLKIANEGENNDMTNLKLQKLLYYIQGTSLALFNQRIFEEDIYKWQYGPVVKEVYQHYKDNGKSIISSNVDIDESLLSDEFKKIIIDVYDFFGRYSAIALMNFTHNEKPWIETEMNEVIDDSLIKNFFNTIVIK